ncbi:class F sortase [Candidatus Saccharibacteria bacterium]|nr:class F sortase [Candidatus Saccharibacteria bacterium]
MSLKISKTANNIIKIVGWIVVIILIVLMAKILIWERGYYSNKSAERRATAPAVITEIAAAIDPSEIQPGEDELNNHQVAADEPRYLDIPRLELQKVIVQGTTVNVHVLQVPDNIYETAWYSGSARPGKGGYIIISGLASGNSGAAGAFANLDSLESGDEITLTTGAGEQYHYAVRSTSIIEESNAKEQLIAAQQTIEDKETLVLVTNLKPSNAENYSSVAIVRAVRKDD